MGFRTHYDNLQLTQDASDEEIRLSYRRLSKKYHPDINPSPDAHRIMQIINKAYEVLSDPQRRQLHDEWIAEKIREQCLSAPPPILYRSGSIVPSFTASNKKSRVVVVASILTLLVFLMSLLAWQIWSLYRDKVDELAILTAQQQEQAYIRPATAPNGSLWPSEAAYVDGYPIVTGNDDCILTVENVYNPSDVFVELFKQGQPNAMRTFFIHARGQFVLNKLDAGEYTIQYRQLQTGHYISSSPIYLGENQRSLTVLLQSNQSLKPLKP